MADFVPASTQRSHLFDNDTVGADLLSEMELIAENVPKWPGIAVSAVEWLIRDRQILSLVLLSG